MDLVILRSTQPPHDAKPQGPYLQEFRSPFADRLVGNLRGEDTFCSSCGPDCVACRARYDRKFGRSIRRVIALPGVLPYLLEHPAEHVPRDVPPHDVLLAVNIHEQILVETLKRCREWGTRAVVVPQEAPDWISWSAREEAAAICAKHGVEIAFPKPFCSFDPAGETMLAEFRRRFHIGKPEVALAVRDGRIEEASVQVSAACGATYYVARWLEGRSVEEDLRHDVVSRRLHSYPCTASMKWDDELGDTPLHVAGRAHYEILAPLAAAGSAEVELVRSPLGRMVQKPVPPPENAEQIERAKRIIQDALDREGAVTLHALRAHPNTTPAALSTALLLLRQAGKIHLDGETVRPG